MSRKLISSTPEDDAAIAAAIADDPDAAPDLVEAERAGGIQRIGRPKSAAPKEAVSIRIDPEVLAYFKASGPGWQSRINTALRQAAGLMPGTGQRH